MAGKHLGRGRIVKHGDSFVRADFISPEHVKDLRENWLAQHQDRMNALMAQLNVVLVAKPEDYTPYERAAMLLELLYFFEGQLHARKHDFLDAVDAGNCLDFQLDEAGLQGGNELPTPKGGHCNDLFDPVTLGLPEDFDTETCRLSEWFEFMRRVAFQWQGETTLLLSQLDD